MVDFKSDFITKGNASASSFKTDGGTSSDFVKGDGTLEPETRRVDAVLVDGTTNNAVGDKVGDVYFTIREDLNGFDLIDADASVDTAGTTGTQDIQIHNVTTAVDMLSTAITIDSGETTSYTALTPPVINTLNDNVSTGDQLRFDVDAIHTTPAKGLR
jgi:hypothetical protein